MKRDKNNKNDAYSTMNVILRICLSIYAHIPEAKPHAKKKKIYTILKYQKSEKEGGRVSISQRQTKLHA
jgi:hypothetical protein